MANQTLEQRIDKEELTMKTTQQAINENLTTLLKEMNNELLDFVKRSNTAFYSGTNKEIKEIMSESKFLIRKVEGLTK